MYFPWCGLIEQIRMADVFIHYDDVQLSRGFYNRVQVKTPQGRTFITVPLRNKHQKQLIQESGINYEEEWVTHHRSVLINSYRRTKFIDDVIGLFDYVNSVRYQNLSDLCKASIRALSKYFRCEESVIFLNSSDLSITGASSQRLLDLTKAVGGNIYLTGLGALNYLNHEMFEEAGIEVRYMRYSFLEYPQVFGAFTPYVTALDAVAHLGKDCKGVLNSTNVNWRDAIERPDSLRA
jgi:hypothetical protein